MKQRLLTGWTFNRALFSVMGIIIIIQALMIQQWAGVLLGGYFVVSGVFALGCAGGNCLGGSCTTNNQTIPENTGPEK